MNKIDLITFTYKIERNSGLGCVQDISAVPYQNLCLVVFQYIFQFSVFYRWNTAKFAPNIRKEYNPGYNISEF